jgi:hypothetical protein
MTIETDTSSEYEGTGTIEEAAAQFLALEGGDEPNPDQDETEADPEADEATEADEADETTDEADEADEGSDEDADAEDEESDATLKPETPVTVKIDGKDVQIPLKEALDGYQRQADYTRKTQALAAERNQFYGEVEALRQERAVYAQLLPALQAQLQSQEPDWQTLKDQDPLGYAIKREEWRELQERNAAIQAEQARIAQMSQIDQQRALQGYVHNEFQRLVAAKPEWADEGTRRKALGEVKEYAKTIGFTDEELAQAYDHRAILAMHKAMQYDRMMAKAKGKPVPQQAQPQRQPQRPTAPTLKPGSANTPPRKTTELTRAKQRLAKTGSVSDAAKIFEKFL